MTELVRTAQRRGIGKMGYEVPDCGHERLSACCVGDRADLYVLKAVEVVKAEALNKPRFTVLDLKEH